MHWMLLARLSSILLLAPPGAPPAGEAGAKPKLLILDLGAVGGADKDAAQTLTEAIAATVGRVGYFQVISSKEIQTLLGLERQRQMVGCSEEGACLAELAGALGAKLALSGTLAKLGDAYQLTLQMIDSGKAQTLSRSIRIAKNIEILEQQLPFAIAEATGTPPPPQPSHLFAYSLMGGGTAAVVLGGVVGLQALSQEQSVVSELQLGEQGRATLKPASYYADQATSVDRGKLIAVGVMAAGAVLVGLGFFLNPSDAAVSGGVKTALVPTGSGAAWVGTW